MMSIRTVPFDLTHASDAARMFVASFDTLRRRVPAVPPDLADEDQVRERLTGMRGAVALAGDRVVGYLTSWFPIASFRGTARVGAYVPEWAHGAIGMDRRAVYSALYRATSVGWSSAGCDVHAITLLAGDDAAIEAWFWNGFGLGTVDAIRLAIPLGAPALARGTVRIASATDAARLAVLDVEHARHYAEPPVLMAPPKVLDEAGWTAFLGRPGNSAWLAEDDGEPFAFVRFDREFHASAIVASAAGIFISGAYVRPPRRGQGAATAILDAAMRHYAAAGITSCAVDFEAFNPEAAAFWPRHFTPVCYSLMRAPEVPRGPAPASEARLASPTA